jgi:hypothetical protein
VTALAELVVMCSKKVLFSWSQQEHIGNHEAKVPMVCFRLGSPPLPDSVCE